MIKRRFNTKPLPPEVIATRIFDLRQDDGSMDAVHLTIWKPCQDGRDWRCDYTFDMPDGNVIARHGFGVDSLQALTLALHRVKLEIEYRLAHKYADRLTFLGDVPFLQLDFPPEDERRMP
jgi:hypothetical protein